MKNYLVRIKSLFVLFLVILLATGCVPLNQNNDDPILIMPAVTAHAPSETYDIDYSSVSRLQLINTNALLKVVRSAAENNPSSSNNYCSYILNRFYIASVCAGDSEMAAFCLGVYDAIVNSRADYKVPEEISLSITKMRRAMYAIFDDCPELMNATASYRFYTTSDNQYVVRIEFEYVMTPQEYFNALSSVYTKLDDWATEYPGSFANASDYDKEIYIYYRILEACSYSETADYRDNAYGAIVLGEALCEGYSQTFTLAMHYFNILCMQIGGNAYDPSTGESESHAWNIVRIGGSFYHADPTWDDYDDSLASASLYAYFNIPDSEILTHRIYNEKYSDFTIPKCASVKHSYYNYSGIFLDTSTDMRAFMLEQVNMLSNAFPKTPYTLTLNIKFETSHMFEVLRSELSNWLGEWNSVSTNGYYVESFNSRSLESMRVMCLEIVLEQYESAIDTTQTPMPAHISLPTPTASTSHDSAPTQTPPVPAA